MIPDIVAENRIQAAFQRDRDAYIRARIEGAVRSGPVEVVELLYLFPELSEKRAREHVSAVMRKIGAKAMGAVKDRYWQMPAKEAT